MYVSIIEIHETGTTGTGWNVWHYECFVSQVYCVEVCLNVVIAFMKWLNTATAEQQIVLS